MSRRPLAILTALLLGPAVAGLTACGSSDRLLPATQATSLERALQQVSDGTSARDCGAALAGLADARRLAAALPASVDRRLRRRLEDGLAQLGRTVPEQCRETAPQTPAQPRTTTTSTTTTSTTTTQPTTTTTTPPPSTTTTPPPPSTTTPPATTTTPNGGISPDQPAGGGAAP